MRRVDVIVPTYQNVSELRACLVALEQQRDVRVRVIVCVDGSTDGTLEYLSDASTPYPLVVLGHEDGRNHGRAATRNLALPRLEAEHVALLDSDMQLVPGGIAAHLAVLDGPGRVSIGDVRYTNVDSTLWARFLTTRGRYKFQPGSSVGPLEFNTQNAALVTADLLAIDGFDEALSAYGGEDTDLALRLAKERSATFVYNVDARAESIEWKTVDQGLAEQRRYGATNLRRIREKHPGPPAPYWLDRLESRRPADRLFRSLLNPVSDNIARAMLRIPVFAIQRLALNYLVLRSVWQGYTEGAA